VRPTLRRPSPRRPGTALAVVGAALAAAGCGGGEPGPSGAAAQGATYALMQMNLCLSGRAGCYGRVAYPAGVEDAVARIRQARPDAVTLNETCRGDVERIARRTAYHVRFTRVVYAGALLPCISPGGRGLFGDAVLTRAPVVRSETHDFTGQSGPERRRWLCVTTRGGIDVCTAHVNTRSRVEVAGNDAQCAEIARILARRAATRTVIFGGDVNRRRSCAPAGAWTRTDEEGRQAGGLQHVYGSRALRSPTAQVIPALHTDHDVLLVRARLAPVR
jgi:endonuclease/exonuclease/phosphatase family metal-dependent hydrolase